MTPAITTRYLQAEPRRQVAIVTGAARGIGRGAACLLKTGGAHIVASDSEVRGMSDHDVATLTGDVADEATARATVTLALERFGRVDILVSNAGRTLNQPFIDTSAAEWPQ